MIDLRKVFENYVGDPHQLAAIDILMTQMPPELLDADAEWFDCYTVECEIIDTTPCKVKKSWQ